MQVDAAAIARYFIVGLSGPHLSAREKELLKGYPPAGIILFERNVESLDQLIDLTNEVNSLLIGAGRGSLKPIISADHEGGRISVLFKALGVPPSQMVLARCADLDLCRSVYLETAERLQSAGINTLLAPVADINSELFNPVIGTRSFGVRSEEVIPFIAESVKALRQGGIAPCLKHFPGHGASLSDSHVALPHISKSIDEMMESDLVCFGEGIKAGADMVMVGHLSVEGFEHPTSLSVDFVEKVLRNKLLFDGLAISDALEMKGAVPSTRSSYSQDSDIMNFRYIDLFCYQLELALRANDLLLYASPVEDVYAQLERCFTVFPEKMPVIAEFATNGKNDSIERIERFKRRLSGMHSPGRQAAQGDSFGKSEAYRNVAQCIVKIETESSNKDAFKDGVAEGALFIGDREDFENGVVRRFIRRVHELVGDRTSSKDAERQTVRGDKSRLNGLLKEGGGLTLRSVNKGDNIWNEYARFGEAFVLKVSGGSSSGGEEGFFYILKVGPIDEGQRVLLFVLNRRPFRSEFLAEIIGHLDIDGVVFEGWPFGRDSLNIEPPTLVTYDIYDGLAESFFLGDKNQGVSR